MNWPWYIAGSVAFFATLLFTPLVIRLAHAREWLAYPEADRWHETPTALMGGLAIAPAVFAGWMGSGPSQASFLIAGGALLMFVVGFIDDRYGVQPSAKLAAQSIATALLLFAGYAFAESWSIWISFPLTFLWVVGITNAINLLDNMDGLAAGIAGIAALVMAGFAAWVGQPVAVLWGLVVSGASLGFLVFNFNPARIFMGDCGSLFLGYLIASLAVMIQQEVPPAVQGAAVLVPVAVLAVPILDTTLVTFVRKLAGRAVSQGGRDHTSHRLVFLGLSERHAVLMLYGLSLLSGGLALAALVVDLKLFYALMGFWAIALIVFGIQLARADVYESSGAPTQGDGHGAAASRRRNPSHLLYRLFGDRWKAFLGVLADMVLVAAAFVLAHYLRFEQGLSVPHEEQLTLLLPLVVGIKIAVFYAMGLYRGIWRHAGTPEIVRAGAATALASLVVGGLIAAWQGPNRVSLAVLIIDWMTVTLAVTGVRFGFRGLRQYLASKANQGARALLYGAGAAGSLAVRELRQNDHLDLVPVGFLDDDPLKQGQRIQGLQVLGRGGSLEALCQAHDIETLIITTDHLSARKRLRLHERCAALGIPCRQFDLSIQAVPTSNERPVLIRPSGP
ncbi:glycosyl transferase [Salisaeta longa]|uniref:glycosyl transferase n=1 Tax=Salisaeta longa TaxID=503170 RepID=UPI0003B74A7C|nr:glycosyl transferase [Salisaeta longa]